MANFLSHINTSGENVPILDYFPDENLFDVSIQSPWFADIANYLSSRKLPPHFSSKEKRQVIKQSARYSWIKGDIFYTKNALITRRCIREDNFLDILKACHDEPCGGHFVDKRTTYKILCLGYYWPTLFRDTKKYVRSCDSCQRMGKSIARDEIQLQRQVLIEPFQKWDLDFVGPIDPPSQGKRYILVCIDYVTKWVEEKALVRATEQSVVNFLFDIFLLDLEFQEKFLLTKENSLLPNL